MTNKPRILVTSAAGRTGPAAVLELLRKGFPVRAFVRRNDVRSEKLRKAGAEIFVGDLFDLSDLRNALVDVQRAYQVGLTHVQVQTGAVTLIQRFGSAANLNIHLHCLMLDGVYRLTDGVPVFQSMPAPTPP